MSAFPDHFGAEYTQTIHSKAKGPTTPENNKVGAPFVVLVTGAGKGLGFHTSLAYARAGASGIIISSRTKSDLDGLAGKILEINPKIDVLSKVCDTTKSEDLAGLAGQVQSHFGRLDVVVANAGVTSKYIQDSDGSNRRLPVGIVEDLDFERVIDINLMGSVRVARHFIPLLISTHDGPQSFVVITSLASHFTESALVPAAYNISKIATNRIAEHIHNDFHEKYGVQAFAVHPGAVLTPQTELHSTEKGDTWDSVLTDDIGLCGGFLTWLTKVKRPWLSGRYISVTWDVEELEARKEEIVEGDKLKFKMSI